MILPTRIATPILESIQKNWTGGPSEVLPVFRRHLLHPRTRKLISTNSTTSHALLLRPMKRVVMTVRKSASSASTCEHYHALKAQGRMSRCSNARSIDKMLNLSFLLQKLREERWSCFRYPLQRGGQVRKTTKPTTIQGEIAIMNDTRKIVRSSQGILISTRTRYAHWGSCQNRQSLIR